MIEILKNIIKDFHTVKMTRNIIPRQLLVPLDSSKVITIAGPRRAGKSYYLHSLINKLKQKIPTEKILYINFEDERIIKENFRFQDIIDAYIQLYPENELSEVYFFFDEIQELNNWAVFVRRLNETISSHIFITGSSAKMLSSQMAGALRGRAIEYNLFPLSFKEYCRFKAIDTDDIYSTKNRNCLFTAYRNFIHCGGYPETVDFDEELRVKTLQSYTDIMLYRDIIERHNIKNLYVVRDMSRRLIANSAQFFSVNKYFNDLKSRGYKIGKNDLYEYLEYYSDAFFIYQLKKQSESISTQQQSLKKIYTIDSGIITAENYTMAANNGYLLENLICNELIKHNKEIFYSKNGYECDFIVLTHDRIEELIQVCFNLNETNKKREYKGIISAAKLFNKQQGLIITDNEERNISINGIDITIIPAWKWLLQLGT